MPLAGQWVSTEASDGPSVAGLGGEHVELQRQQRRHHVDAVSGAVLKARRSPATTFDQEAAGSSVGVTDTVPRPLIAAHTDRRLARSLVTRLKCSEKRIVSPSIAATACVDID
jgi:hypothetical protein